MYFSSGTAGFEDRKCPQCGTLLTHPNVTAPYNIHFKNPGPYFCSQICFDKILEPRIKRHLRPPTTEDPDMVAQRSAIYDKQILIQETLGKARRNLDTEDYLAVAEAAEKENARCSRKIEVLESRPKINSPKDFEDARKAAIDELTDDWQRGWNEWLSDQWRKDDAKFYKENPIIKIVPPLDIDQQIKFDHTLCLASSGAGKTTLMFDEILENLKKSDPPAMVIIDPKGTVLKEISSLACFHPTNGIHKDRLIIIDPSDIEGPPAFNLFKPTNESRAGHYDANARTVLENKVVELLQYIFSSRKQILTGKQAPCFSAVCRLMLKLPDPGLPLLFDILNEQQSEKRQSLENCPALWRAAVARLPELSGRFFKEQYFTNYTSTRDEISSRLYGIVEHPSIQSVFNARENKFDMFEALQTGKTVIVNVPNALLTSAGAELFGRYMIALTLAAAFERITIRDKSKWRPAFLYIDEFQEFADEDKSTELLRLVANTSLASSCACRTSRRSKRTRSNRPSLPTRASNTLARLPLTRARWRRR